MARIILNNLHLFILPDLSSIPSGHLASEEPETFEIKPLITPRHEPEVENKPTSLSDQSEEPRPSAFNFPSEDEPVTMISKSISPITYKNQAQQGKSAAQRSLSGSSFGSEQSEGVPSVVNESSIEAVSKGQPLMSPPPLQKEELLFHSAATPVKTSSRHQSQLGSLESASFSSRDSENNNDVALLDEDNLPVSKQSNMYM